MISTQVDNAERFDKLMTYCEELNERLREQEKYSGKDSVVILNPPFDAKDEKNLAQNVIWFCKNTCMLMSLIVI